MPDQSKYYALGAFVLGIGLTVAYNHQFAPTSDDSSSKILLKQRKKWLAGIAKINDLETLKKSLLDYDDSLEENTGSFKEGIEGCIGNTPLIKIKSLSDYTGCEILAKAEVCMVSLLLCLADVEISSSMGLVTVLKTELR